MRVKMWMIVVGAVALCVVWVALFKAHPAESTPLPSDTSRGYVQIVKWSMAQIWTLTTEIGATVLAAVAIGFWTVRRPS